MKCDNLVLVFIAATITSVSGNEMGQHYDISNAQTYFQQFMTEQNRQYKDEVDKELHFRAFVASLEKTNKLNEKSLSATYDINQYADYTEEDRERMSKLRKNRNLDESPESNENEEIHDNYNDNSNEGEEELDIAQFV